MNDRPNQSTASLLGDAMSHVSALVRSEVDLSRAEIDNNLSRAATAIGLLVAAVIIALTALNVLVSAIVAGLVEAGMEPGWAALIVGVVLAIVAFVLIQKGTKDLKLISIAPTRTAENVKRDANAIKGAVDAH